MTTVAVGSENPVLESRPAARAFVGETFGFLGTWLRIVWRHWPVLLSLAFAGTIVRELLIDATTKASTWREGLGAVFVFPLVPAGLLIAMVLMLRTVRPSLPYLGRRARPESILVYLASVLLPFLTFYFAAGYANYDKDRFRYQVATSFLFGDSRSALYAGGVIVVVVAVLAFGLRWVFNRFEFIRRRPWLVFPALYLEMLWLYSLFLALDSYQPKGTSWIDGSRVWQAYMTWWHTALDPAHPATGLLAAGRTSVDVFSDAAGQVLLAPVAALVAGSVVLAARTSRRSTVDDGTSTSRRVLRIGVEAGRPVGGRFGLIVDGIRRVFQAGVPATMVFCLAYVGLISLGWLLMEPERLLIGARDVERVWKWINFPLQFVNDAIVLVLTVCLIAAFVDRTAARIARRGGEPTPDDAPAPAPASVAPSPAFGGPVTSTTIVVPEQSTVRLGPPPGAGGTPGYGGVSPITPTYTTPTLNPPTYGSSFGASPPPPAPPQPSGPAGELAGLWEDGQQDVPGKELRPGDTDAGWSGFGR